MMAVVTENGTSPNGNHAFTNGASKNPKAMNGVNGHANAAPLSQRKPTPKRKSSGFLARSFSLAARSATPHQKGSYIACC